MPIASPDIRVKAPEGPPKPNLVEKPKQPFGQAEESIINEIKIATTQQKGNPDQTLQNIVSTPKFIREFSKEQSKEERQQTARDIRETRREHFGQKQEVVEQQTQLQEETSKKELVLAEQRQRLEVLRDEVDHLSGPWFSRLLNYTKLRGLNADLQTAEVAYQNFQQEETALRTQGQVVEAEADKLKDAPKLEEGRQKLQSFYKNEKEKWAAADYTKGDIARYFTEDHLASLSTEDYALLLKRFPSEMVTHVTRQGIRDHVGGDFHTRGLGEYFDNFKQILQDGRLRSHFGALFKDGLTKAAVAQALELGRSVKTKKEAKIKLSNFIQSGPGSYADRTALHAALEQVADNIYGAEKGNEIFFVFPSAHIASEHYFNSAISGTGTEDANVEYIGQNIDKLKVNDNWIWTKDQVGLAIKAGIVFIPVDAKVDPQTGSKYELTFDKKAVELEDRITLVAQLIKSEKFNEIYQEISQKSLMFASQEEIQLLRQKLSSEFGISDPRVQDTILDENNLSDLYASYNRDAHEAMLKANGQYELYSPENIAREILLKSGFLFKEAETTVSSKDFWERYFDQHPEQRPKRTVYYEGGDPTKALSEWRESHDITKRAESEDLGFSEKLISTDSPHAIAGKDRFQSIAKEAIDDYFNKSKAA